MSAPRSARGLAARATALALVLALAPRVACAAPVAEPDVRAAVLTWVRSVTADARPDARIARTQAWVAGADTVAWIVALEGGGYCLAGADDAVLPVYLYCPRGAFDPAADGPRAILDEIRVRTLAGRSALGRPATPAAIARAADRARYWRALVTGTRPARLESVTATPVPAMLQLPLACLWDQGVPYDNELPKPDPNYRPVLTGCNATATGQIMYWWKWPVTGAGSASVPYQVRYRSTWDSQPLASAPTLDPGTWSGRLRWSAGYLQMNGYWDSSVFDAANSIQSPPPGYSTALAALYSRLTVDTPQVWIAQPGLSTYDWSIIPAVPGGDAAANSALARFMHDVTICCQTSMGLFGSGSNFTNDAAALRNNFLYDHDALASSTATSDALTTEIEWGRVAGLGGSNSDGAGHAWVIDGYNSGTDPERQFHMNFGWSGQSNAWYTLDTTPPAPDYPLSHDMMTRIAPPNVKFVGNSVSGDGSPSSPYLDVAQAVASAPNGSTLMLKASTAYTYHGVINKPLKIKGYGARVQ